MATGCKDGGVLCAKVLWLPATRGCCIYIALMVDLFIGLAVLCYVGGQSDWCKALLVVANLMVSDSEQRSGGNVKEGAGMEQLQI